jgi:peptidoglycan hydrolase-like protein with peptidoglycan-binding domain
MPFFDSNDPASFGWQLGSGNVVPFVYRGHSFPGGVDKRLSAVFTKALDAICAQPNFALHSGSGLGDGDWGYEHRMVTSGSVLSFHAYGAALDINAPWNAYGSSTPPMSPYRLPLNTSELIEPLGLLWGGGPRWGSHRDWMHIECHLSPAEVTIGQAQPVPPPRSGTAFPLPAGYYYGPYTGPAASISGMPATDAAYRPGLMAAQRKLGVSADGQYGPATEAGARSWQYAHGLVIDGLIGLQTWNSLFP